MYLAYQFSSHKSQINSLSLSLSRFHSRLRQSGLLFLQFCNFCMFLFSQFQGGNASDADAYGNQAGADGRRRFRIQIGGPESNEGTDSFQQGRQTALPFLHQPAYYHASQQAPSDQPTTPSNPAVFLRNLRLLHSHSFSVYPLL